MPHVARSMGWLFALLLAVGGARQAVADYPDYAPSPPPVEGDRPAPYPEDQDAGRPAEASEPADRYQPVDPQRPSGLRQPGDLRPAADAVAPAGPRRPVETSGPAELRRPADAGSPVEPGEGPGGPRPLQVQFQPAEYQAPVAVQAAVEFEPAPPKPAPAQPSIPLIPPSPQARSVLRTPDVPPVVAGAASLGIVLGLFLLVVWVMRRGMPKNATLLPREAVEVLGRAPLIGREHVYLIRCGNKMLLVSVAAGKAETLTEITDPSEVDRLAGICQQLHPHSVTTSFRQVFQQFGQPQHARDFLARRQADDLEFSHADEVGHYGVQESHA